MEKYFSNFQPHLFLIGFFMALIWNQIRMVRKRIHLSEELNSRRFEDAMTKMQGISSQLQSLEAQSSSHNFHIGVITGHMLKKEAQAGLPAPPSGKKRGRKPKQLQQ